MNAVRLILAAIAINAYVLQPATAREDGFVPLFNGKDLSGWVNVNCAPKTFTVRDGLIHCTGVPTGVMRTEKQYENFVLELEWRHMKPKGNAGLFVWSDAITAPGIPFTRSIEVQILDGRNTETYTSHGDVFSIHGATLKPDRPHPAGAMRCLPSERRCKPAGKWNHYRVFCNDGILKLAVNGKVVSGASQCNPRKGYLCLESEGSEVHFRNIRIKELPSTNPTPDQVASLATGFQSLYTGVDLAGWKHVDGHKAHWQAANWRLRYDGKCEAKDKNLWSAKDYGDFVMICDWRFTAKPVKRNRQVILPNGDVAVDKDGKPKLLEVDDAGDSGIYLRGSSKSQVNMWCWPIGSGEVYGYRTDKNQPAEVRKGVTPKVVADNPIGRWNRFVITMKQDRLTVVLNSKTVLENAQLPGVAPRGPIALQHHGDPIEFANIFIKELDQDQSPGSGKTLILNARSRVESEPGSRKFQVVQQKTKWNGKQTAIVVCDMWAEHWCKGATRRVAEMAPRMNDVITKARKQGVLIIHCPSGGMEFYKDTPMRKLAQQAAKIGTKIPLQGWCHLDKSREAALPIDDTDGGCDCQPRCKGKVKRPQIASIKMLEGDAITDSAEAYYLMKQRGITNVIVMGVHTNMCVLGRPFSIRQMKYQGQDVMLMRDLTDTMYNSRMKPFVSHFTGTDLVIEHIEKYWCPTITSADFLAGKPHRFRNDARAAK